MSSEDSRANMPISLVTRAVWRVARTIRRDYGQKLHADGRTREKLGCPSNSERALTTGARPEKPKTRAPAGVTSITRPRTNGPRSLIRTVTLRPLRRLVTRTCVPNASVRCAAVSPVGFARSPLAVLEPEYAYTDAIPDSAIALGEPVMKSAAAPQIVMTTPMIRTIPSLACCLCSSYSERGASFEYFTKANSRKTWPSRHYDDPPSASPFFRSFVR